MAWQQSRLATTHSTLLIASGEAASKILYPWLIPFDPPPSLLFEVGRRAGRVVVCPPQAEFEFFGHNTSGGWPCSLPGGHGASHYPNFTSLIDSPFLLLVGDGAGQWNGWGRLLTGNRVVLATNTMGNLALLIASRQTASQLPHPRSISTYPTSFVIV